MACVLVDVEADGPIPGDYSMICFGADVVSDELKQVFPSRHFTGGNPFGHSSTNLGSLYKGMVMNMSKNFKHLRKTAHTHHPVDDARGNAEALLAMKQMGLKIAL